MKNIVFLFVGLILIITGIIVSINTGTVRVNNQVMSGESATHITWAIGGGIGALGLIFLLIGFIGRIKDKKNSEQLAFIVQTGIEAIAVVTFFDKNYLTLVNNRPIYSIIEYKYKDNAGAEHMRRVNNISSDWAIRNKIEVGCNLKIKYLQEDPSQSAILVFK